VTDEELSPNHAWRHTFKQIADRAGITERTSDYITGHRHRTTGAAYGAPTLEDMGSGAGEVSEIRDLTNEAYVPAGELGFAPRPQPISEIEDFSRSASPVVGALWERVKDLLNECSRLMLKT
jgi:hypothetical protein